ncbi:hypothetical protein FACS189430_11550 [Bacteroidia bacterium]|nr:hypothetical protein FACS189430_11550 [Bacteroidia bacterium]
MGNLIIRIHLTSLRNEAHVELNETFAALVAKYNAETLDIAALFGQYQPLLADELSVLDLVRKSGLTGDIDEQDHRRDSVFRGFADAVKNACRHFDSAKREAANRVEMVFAHYGNIAVKTLDQETAAIDDLLRELDAAHSAAIATLNLGDWALQLNAENSRFKELMAARYEETAQRPTIRMKSARTAVDNALRDIFDRVEALALVNGVAASEPFIKELNAVMERYKNILAQEKGRRNGETSERTNG